MYLHGLAADAVSTGEQRRRADRPDASSVNAYASASPQVELVTNALTYYLTLADIESTESY